LPADGAAAAAAASSLDRAILAAGPLGDLRAALPPLRDPSDTALCTKDALWQAQNDGYPADPGSQHLGRAQRFGSPTLWPPDLPGPDWRVADASTDGRQILLVAPTAPGRDRSRLYLAAADGGAPRLLDDRPGLPLGAQFSPDGRWVLLYLRPPGTPHPAITRSFWLLDTSGASPPRALLDRQEDFSENGQAHMAAVFFRTGPRAGQLAVSWSEWTGQHLRLVTPAASGPPVDLLLTPRMTDIFLWSYTADGAGGFLIGGLRAYPGAGAGTTLVYVDLGDSAHVFHLRAGLLDPLWGAWVRGPWLIYAQGGAAPAGEMATTLYRVPLAALDDPAPPITPLYATAPAMGAARPTLPWYVGPARLAYVTPAGALRTRRFDGTGDLALGADAVGFAGLGFGDRP